MKIASIMPPVMRADPVSGHRYHGWQPCIDWCSQNCSGPWLFISEGVFEFELDTDYTMFMLRWA
jgi:hypothetical protein